MKPNDTIKFTSEKKNSTFSHQSKDFGSSSIDNNQIGLATTKIKPTIFDQYVLNKGTKRVAGRDRYSGQIRGDNQKNGPSTTSTQKSNIYTKKRGHVIKQSPRQTLIMNRMIDSSTIDKESTSPQYNTISQSDLHKNQEPDSGSSVVKIRLKPSQIKFVSSKKTTQQSQMNERQQLDGISSIINQPNNSLKKTRSRARKGFHERKQGEQGKNSSLFKIPESMQHKKNYTQIHNQASTHGRNQLTGDANVTTMNESTNLMKQGPKETNTSQNVQRRSHYLQSDTKQKSKQNRNSQNSSPRPKLLQRSKLASSQTPNMEKRQSKVGQPATKLHPQADHQQINRPVQANIADLGVLSEPDYDAVQIALDRKPESPRLSEGEENIQTFTHRHSNIESQMKKNANMVTQNISSLEKSALARAQHQTYKPRKELPDSEEDERMNCSSDEDKSIPRSPGGKVQVRRLFQGTGQMRIAGVSQKRRLPHKPKQLDEDEVVATPQEQIYYSRAANNKTKSNVRLEEYEIDLQSEERSAIGNMDQNTVRRSAQGGFMSEMNGPSNAAGPKATISIQELSQQLSLNRVQSKLVKENTVKQKLEESKISMVRERSQEPVVVDEDQEIDDFELNMIEAEIDDAQSVQHKKNKESCMLQGNIMTKTMTFKSVIGSQLPFQNLENSAESMVLPASLSKTQAIKGISQIADYIIEDEQSASKVNSGRVNRDFSMDQKQYFSSNQPIKMFKREIDGINAKSVHQNSVQKKTINYINNQNQLGSLNAEQTWRPRGSQDVKINNDDLLDTGMMPQPYSLAAVPINEAFPHRKNSINTSKGFEMNKNSLQRSVSSVARKRYTMSTTSTQTELSITKKDLKYITANMLNLHLQAINVSYNKLMHLPDEICTLPSLHTLRVEHNNIKSLPKQLGNLKNLRNLNARYNELIDLPESLSECSNLRELVVNDNRIEFLYPDLGKNKELKNLQLHGNRIQLLPNSLQLLDKIESISLEWFQYLDPPQQLLQTGSQSMYVIEALKGFLNTTMEIEDIGKFPELKVEEEKEPNKDKKLIPGKDVSKPDMKQHKSFVQFLCYFYLYKPKNKTSIKSSEIIKGIDQISFTSKQRCICSTICSNKHVFLLEQIIKTKYNCKFALIINQKINLNNIDIHEQAPLMAAIRQQTSDFALTLLESQSVNKININQLSQKHGYPLHIAILSSKFDVAVEMLKKPDIDPHILNTIQANSCHLLFLKYDKEPVPAFEVLKLLVKHKVDMNLVDSIGASPIHIAMRKRQYQALQDIVKINNSSQNGHIFNFNMRDKRGQTPLHYAVEKQDYEMFKILLEDKFLNVHLHDEHDFVRARRLSVIFSAFHKILYQREKIQMRKRFYKEVNDHYTEFQQINNFDKRFTTNLLGSQQIYQSRQDSIGVPAPISVSNKTRKNIDFFGIQQQNIMKDAQKFYQTSSGNVQETEDYQNQDSKMKDSIKSKFESSLTMIDHKQFYDNLNEESDFVVGHVFNLRELRKKEAREAQKKSKSKMPISDMYKTSQERGRPLLQMSNHDETRSYSQVSKNSNVLHVNSNSQYFQNDNKQISQLNHKRQKSEQQAFQTASQDFRKKKNLEKYHSKDKIYMSLGPARRRDNTVTVVDFRKDDRNMIEEGSVGALQDSSLTRKQKQILSDKKPVSPTPLTPNYIQISHPQQRLKFNIDSSSDQDDITLIHNNNDHHQKIAQKSISPRNMSNIIRAISRNSEEHEKNFNQQIDNEEVIKNYFTSVKAPIKIQTITKQKQKEFKEISKQQSSSTNPKSIDDLNLEVPQQSIHPDQSSLIDQDTVRDIYNMNIDMSTRTLSQRQNQGIFAQRNSFQTTGRINEEHKQNGFNQQNEADHNSNTNSNQQQQNAQQQQNQQQQVFIGNLNINLNNVYISLPQNNSQNQSSGQQQQNKI